MKNLDAVFSKLSKNIIHAVEESLTESLTTIAEESLKEAPMDSGNMRDSMEITANNQLIGIGDKSGTAEIDNLKLDKTKKNILKVAYTAEYSVHVHEIQFKNYTTSGTKWKYLEDPFNRNIKKMKSDLEKAIQKGVKK